MAKFEYADWVEVKQALKSNDRSVVRAADDSGWGQTTVRLVKKSKSFKNYKELNER